MASLEIVRLLNAPKSLVWEKLSDFGNVHVFHPMVQNSRLTAGTKCGLGAKRICEFYDEKGSVEEEITAWVEEKSLTVALLVGTMPLKSAVFRFYLENADRGKTRLVMNVHFEMKYGIPGNMMGPILMKPMMRKMLGRVLQGLENHCRTGKHIGRNGVILSG